jgi:hypothetical protein
MNWLGIILIVVGVVLTALHPRLKLNLTRLRIRGLAGPALIVLGILVILEILPV